MMTATATPTARHAADGWRARVPRGDDGVAAVDSIVAMTLILLFFFVAVNLVAVSYARIVVRGALDVGVRQGAAAGGDTDVCYDTIAQSLGRLLAGGLGGSITVGCASTPERVTATANASIPGWLPIVPDVAFDVGATAVLDPERIPTP